MLPVSRTSCRAIWLGTAHGGADRRPAGLLAAGPRGDAPAGGGHAVAGGRYPRHARFQPAGRGRKQRPRAPGRVEHCAAADRGGRREHDPPGLAEPARQRGEVFRQPRAGKDPRGLPAAARWRPSVHGQRQWCRL
ncbi:hypothetical protein G6F61_013748 [Rhizopus arrhizus]|nr:hypothetical protein G6F61_013748 [Rhizopus arrhizus]